MYVLRPWNGALLPPIHTHHRPFQGNIYRSRRSRNRDGRNSRGLATPLRMGKGNDSWGMTTTTAITLGTLRKIPSYFFLPIPQLNRKVRPLTITVVWVAHHVIYTIHRAHNHNHIHGHDHDHDHDHNLNFQVVFTEKTLSAFSCLSAVSCVSGSLHPTVDQQLRESSDQRSTNPHK